jgi:hypothetical protein
MWALRKYIIITNKFDSISFYISEKNLWLRSWSMIGKLPEVYILSNILSITYM